jgi:hypothetical protein
VIADEFGNGCGHRKPADFDSSWVADPIDFNLKKVNVSDNNDQPLWVSITVPQNAKAGILQNGYQRKRKQKTYAFACFAGGGQSIARTFAVDF